MIKVTNKNDKAALKVALAITSTNIVSITSDCVMASCRNAAITVTQKHSIPPGQYTCKDYFLDLCEVVPTRHMAVPSPEAEYLGRVPSAPAWEMQMSLAELTGYVFTTRQLKALSVLYKGQQVTVVHDPKATFFTLQNITMVVYRRVHTTKVLVSGLPVTWHQELKELALDRCTSVNKIILAAIKKELV